jgi:predicted dehydrogenase
VIATPPWLHREAFCAVMARGLPCFCEKPMDMDLREADRMRHAARASRAPVLFGFNRRFTPAARLARALRGGEPPQFVHTSKSRPMTYSRMLAENAVHAADLLLCLAASTPEAVRATGAFKDADMEAESFVSAAISFVGGGGGSFQMVTAGHGAVERFEVYGRDYTLVGDLPGSVRYGGLPSRLRDAAAAAGVTLADAGGGRFEVAGEPDMAAEMGTFAAMVRGEPVPPDLPGPEEAFEAQRLVEAIYRSAGLPPSRFTGTWVRER